MGPAVDGDRQGAWPVEAGQRRQADGSLEFWAGSIAVHVFCLDFLAEALDHEDALPFHRAHKKVPFVNDQGETENPAAPNATKFERFIFDLMPVAKNAIVVEAAEEDAFAPLKNASGAAKDTPETSRAAIVAPFGKVSCDCAGLPWKGCFATYMLVLVAIFSLLFYCQLIAMGQ